MRVNWLSSILAGFILFFFTALANASLSHIGFAFYDHGSEYVGAYRLIYDDDLQLTWLDYMKVKTTWVSASNWALSLNDGWPLFHESLFPDITMNWTGDWELPTDDELRHLYEVDSVGPLSPGPFTNYNDCDGLWSNFTMLGMAGAWVWWYEFWVTPEMPKKVWAPRLEGVAIFYDGYDALAVRHGVIDVPVPIPATVFIFSSGLACLCIIRKNRTRKLQVF